MINVHYYYYYCVVGMLQSDDRGNQFLQYDGYIDLGRELSLLHSVLLDFINRSSEVQCAVDIIQILIVSRHYQTWGGGMLGNFFLNHVNQVPSK